MFLANWKTNEKKLTLAWISFSIAKSDKIKKL